MMLWYLIKFMPLHLNFYIYIHHHFSLFAFIQIYCVNYARCRALFCVHSWSWRQRMEELDEWHSTRQPYDIYKTNVTVTLKSFLNERLICNNDSYQIFAHTAKRYWMGNSEVFGGPSRLAQMDKWAEMRLVGLPIEYFELLGQSDMVGRTDSYLNLQFSDLAWHPQYKRNEFVSVAITTAIISLYWLSLRNKSSHWMCIRLSWLQPGYQISVRGI